MRLLLPADADPIATSYLIAQIFCQKFEVLVEHRLWGNVKLHRRHSRGGNRHFKEDPAELFQPSVEFLFLIHVRRVQPHERAFRKKFHHRNGLPLRVSVGRKVGKNFNLRKLFLGKLGIAVEHADTVHFVTEERNAVGIVP